MDYGTSINEATRRWWDTEDGEVHEHIASVLGVLREETEIRHRKFRRFLHIYSNKRITGWLPGSSSDGDDSGLWGQTPSGEPWSYINPIRSCVETLASRFGAHKIKPKILTDCDTSNITSLRKQAGMIERAVQGEWAEGCVYKKAVACFYDAAIFGMGAMAVFSEDGKIRYERVFPGELVVDESACRTTPPRTLYQVSAYPAETLVARWPDKKDEIMSAIGDFPVGEAQDGYIKVTDMVQVIEAWHLPSKCGAKDGKRAVVIDGCTLDCETWTRDGFPFAFIRWGEPILGWWPQGLVECEEPLQWMINKCERRIQQAIQIYAVMKTYMPKGAVDPGKLRNMVGDVVEYSGPIPPKSEWPLSIPSEVFRYQAERRQLVFEESGVSMMSAASVKPPGVEAAVAMRYLGETETGRHALLGTEWEDFFTTLAKLTIEERRTIGGRAQYRDTDNGKYEEIDWKEATENLNYVLEVFPTSYLPHTPSGRLATIMEMLAAGFFGSPDDQASIGKAMQVLNFPDLTQMVSIETAALEDVDFQIEQMIDGKPQEPEPFQDLKMAQARVVAALLRARRDGVPDDRLELLMNYLDSASELENSAADAVAMREAAAAQAAGQPGPTGPGGPPLPNELPGDLTEGALSPEPLPPQAPMVPELE
jgi:hypothetical protein